MAALLMGVAGCETPRADSQNAGQAIQQVRNQQTPEANFIRCTIGNISALKGKDEGRDYYGEIGGSIDQRNGNIKLGIKDWAKTEGLTDSQTDKVMDSCLKLLDRPTSNNCPPKSDGDKFGWPSPPGGSELTGRAPITMTALPGRLRSVEVEYFCRPPGSSSEPHWRHLAHLTPNNDFSSFTTKYNFDQLREGKTMKCQMRFRGTTCHDELTGLQPVAFTLPKL